MIRDLKHSLNPMIDIADILNKIETIPVKKLSPQADIQFMMKDRHISEEHLTIDLLKAGGKLGETGVTFKVWRDGAIYVIDIKSMASSKRTLSFLAMEKYPELYQLLSEKSQDAPLAPNQTDQDVLNLI